MTMFEIYLIVTVVIFAIIIGIQQYFWLQTIILNKELLTIHKDGINGIVDAIIEFLEENNVDKPIIECIRGVMKCRMNSLKNNVVKQDLTPVSDNVE